MTRSAITSTNKLISSTLSELKKVDKSEAKDYLLGLRAKIDTMLKKFDDGGMVQGYDIQEGLISVGNNASYERGGNINIVKLASDRGVGGNSDKIYEIQSKLKSDGTQQISLIEKPSNRVMAQGEMDEVVNFYNLFHIKVMLMEEELIRDIMIN